MRRKLRDPVKSVSVPLVKLIAGEDYHSGIPIGALPDDVLDFLYFANDRARRRELFRAALPEVKARCRALGIKSPTFDDVLKDHGIPLGLSR